MIIGLDDKVENIYKFTRVFLSPTYQCVFPETQLGRVLVICHNSDQWETCVDFVWNKNMEHELNTIMVFAHEQVEMSHQTSKQNWNFNLTNNNSEKQAMEHFRLHTLKV